VSNSQEKKPTNHEKGGKPRRDIVNKPADLKIKNIIQDYLIHHSLNSLVSATVNPYAIFRAK
jgi:hypothetical protein